MQTNPEQAMRGILLASTCGHHHKKDCTSCASAQNCTNAEIRRLHADLRAFAEREARLVELLDRAAAIIPEHTYINWHCALAALKDRTHG